MTMSSSLLKILETGINVFKSNSHIMKKTKYYEISTKIVFQQVLNSQLTFINLFAHTKV